MLRAIIISTISTLAVTTFHVTPAQAQTQRSCTGQIIEAKSLAFRKKKRAQRSARRTWQRKARRAFGNRWANFEIAEVIATPCPSTGRQYICTYRAKPCQQGRRTLADPGGVTGGNVPQRN